MFADDTLKDGETEVEEKEALPVPDALIGSEDAVDDNIDESGKGEKKKLKTLKKKVSLNNRGQSYNGIIMFRKDWKLFGQSVLLLSKTLFEILQKAGLMKNKYRSQTKD